MSRYATYNFASQMNGHLLIKALSKSLILFLLLSFTVMAQDFGEQGHSMNKLTDNRDILSFWGTTKEADKKLYEEAYKVLSAEKQADYSELMKSEAFKKLAQDQNRKILAGPMLGQIKPTSASVWVRTLSPAKVEVKVEGKEGNFIYGPVYTSTATDLAGLVEITGLKPSSRYTYKIIINGEEVLPELKQSIATLPDVNQGEEVKIAFGSCPHRWGLGNHTLLEQIQERGNQAMLFLGDIAVQDRNDHLGMHRADYLLRDFLPGRALLLKLPFMLPGMTTTILITTRPVYLKGTQKKGVVVSEKYSSILGSTNPMGMKLFKRGYLREIE